MTLELDDRQRAMLQEMGVRVWMPGTAFALQEGEPQRAATAVATKPVGDVVPTVGTSDLNLGSLDWQTLAESAATCQACGLCAGRKQSSLQAPTEAAQADWFFVGDPPDEDEDRQGEPFAGQAGQLLDNML